jgi:hypothetical protein
MKPLEPLEHIIVKTNPKIDEIFSRYPEEVKGKLQFLRSLVIQTAKNTEEIDYLQETLKWGEPSFVTNIGSTLRMDWKAKSPNQVAMYFQCTSRLVSTFKIVFGDTFQYDGSRALIFPLKKEIPVEPLEECIRASLRYRNVKDLITLGM